MKAETEKGKNVMQEIKINKVVLSVGGTAEALDRATKLLERISGRKAVKRKSVKRIPSLGVRPGLDTGAMVTLRGEEAENLLRRLLAAIDNKLKKNKFLRIHFHLG
jgi:Ribosomal protein L5